MIKNLKAVRAGGYKSLNKSGTNIQDYKKGP
jgi:hypothetical protein